jgi:Holliday junction resolvase
VANTSRQGRDNEHQAMKQLAAAGYELVMRSAGSKGVADVIALKPGQVLLVQAKRNGNMTVAEWNGLYSLAVRLGCVPLAARRENPRRVTLTFWRLTAAKDGTPRRQPRELFLLDEVAA